MPVKGSAVLDGVLLRFVTTLVNKENLDNGLSAVSLFLAEVLGGLTGFSASSWS